METQASSGAAKACSSHCTVRSSRAFGCCCRRPVSCPGPVGSKHILAVVCMHVYVMHPNHPWSYQPPRSRAPRTLPFCMALEEVSRWIANRGNGGGSLPGSCTLVGYNGRRAPRLPGRKADVLVRGTREVVYEVLETVPETQRVTAVVVHVFHPQDDGHGGPGSDR